MTSERWGVSLLIVGHLVALVILLLPDPPELATVSADTTNVPLTATASALGGVAAWVREVEPRIVQVVSPLRAVTAPYVAVGLRQRWNMFSNPMPVDQYVRVDQYVQPSRSSPRLRVFRELALPAQREDRVRAVHKFRDKAVLNSLEAFTVARARRAPSEGLPPDLEPVARYFRNRFHREYLTGDEQIVRTDVWFGQVPIPAVGQQRTPEERESRSATLAAYWDGPAETPPVAVLPQIGALQRDGSIIWRLEYSDQP